MNKETALYKFIIIIIIIITLAISQKLLAIY